MSKRKNSYGLLTGLLLLPFAVIGSTSKKGSKIYAFNDKKYKPKGITKR